MVQDETALKNFPVEELKAGMVVGRSLYDDNQNELIAEGTVLTNALIFSLLDRDVFSVWVYEKADIAELIDQHEIDESYLSQYECVIQEMRRVFTEARERGNVDVAAIQKLVRDPFINLVDGARAISHVHNLFREDDYLLHHSINVAILAGVMGQWMRMNQMELEQLVLAGLLHDIGKTQIPLNILNKPGKLSADEMAVMRKHTSLGFDLLRYGVLKDQQKILFGILQHHERMDGSGYPAGLSDGQISEFGRLLAIVDVYDAMAANKVYAQKKSPFDIFSILAEDMMQRLDTKYCVKFIHNICHSLYGNWVELSDGRSAKIVYIDESRIQSLPVVQCGADIFIDLNKTTELKITKLLNTKEVLNKE